mmetsp:Transcript_140475/g.391620  ORF Transcript_140475/g.391620 Transcript_140475/m.391620 type:complete len:210 (-) Transcript_140475:640-1269(-)
MWGDLRGALLAGVVDGGGLPPRVVLVVALAQPPAILGLERALDLVGLAPQGCRLRRRTPRGQGRVLHLLDHPDGHRRLLLPHREAAQRRVLAEGLHAHRGLGPEPDHGRVARVERLRPRLEHLARATVRPGEQLLEDARHPGSVALHPQHAARPDLPGPGRAEDDDLREEGGALTCGAVVGNGCDHSVAQLLHRDVNGNVHAVPTNRLL